MAGQGQPLPASHAVYIPIETMESRRRPTNPTPLKEEIDNDFTIVHISCYVVALFSMVYIIGSHIHTYINTCNPELYLKSVSVTPFDIKLPFMNIGWKIVYDVKNPSNDTKLLWENSVVSVSYAHQLLGATVMNSFYQNAKDQTIVEATIPSSKIKLDPWMTRVMDIERVKNGALDFNVNMEGRMWRDHGHDMAYLYSITADCLVGVEFPVNATVGTSAGGLWPCYVKTKKQGELGGL